MRKIFAILLVSLIGFVAKAQVPVATMTNSASAIVNTGTVSATKAVAKAYTTLTVQSVVTKVSGTLSTSATAVLYGSLDGVNYTAIGEDTLKMANQTTNTKFWYISPSKHYYYKVLYTGSGTMNATPVTYIMGK